MGEIYHAWTFFSWIDFLALNVNAALLGRILQTARLPAV
jgi:hypothetical protein